MKVQIHSVHFDADKKLLDYTEDKCSKLNKFFNGIVGAEVFLSMDNASSGNKNVEIKLAVAKNVLIAKERSKTFEEGITACVQSLTRQLKKHKEKLQGR